MKRRIFLLVLILSWGLSTMSGTVRQVPDEGEIIPVKFKPKRTIDDKKCWWWHWWMEWKYRWCSMGWSTITLFNDLKKCYD